MSLFALVDLSTSDYVIVACQLIIAVCSVILAKCGWKKTNGVHPPPDRRKGPDRRRRKPKPKQE